MLKQDSGKLTPKSATWQSEVCRDFDGGCCWCSFSLAVQNHQKYLVSRCLECLEPLKAKSEEMFGVSFAKLDLPGKDGCRMFQQLVNLEDQLGSKNSFKCWMLS